MEKIASAKNIKSINNAREEFLDKKKSRKIKEKLNETLKESSNVKWLSELSAKSGNVAGGKGANLAEMYNIGLPVPPAFVITAQAFDNFLKVSDLKQKIKEIIEKTNVDNTSELEINAKKIRELIINSAMPEDISSEIIESYKLLSSEKSKDILDEKKSGDNKEKNQEISVAVRSSATTEDLSTASFAGQQETFTNIRGEKQLIEAVKKCFASLYTARAVYYRHKKGFDKANALLAVVVQKMIDSEKSGVIFTKNPATGVNEIIIEAVFGLGEGIVSGTILPDHYVLSPDLELQEKKIANKKIAMIREENGNGKIVKLKEDKSKSQVLTLADLVTLASLAQRIEKHYKKPQDIEFSISQQRIYIVQSRPITTLEHKNLKEKRKLGLGEIILTGLAASPGIASGFVKLILDMSDLKKIRKGDVLVTKMTNPDMVVSMQKAAGIITDEGGVTAHAAIVSREMGIPCVTGTEHATEILKDGVFVTIDGTNGKVYKGKPEILESEGENGKINQKKQIQPIIKGTRTKIKVMVDLPDFAERAAKTECDSVGLLRLEGIIAESGKHPLFFLENKNTNANEYSEIIEKGIEKISKHFKEIWIRTSDIRTDEYQHLQGAPKEKELNPMLGFHGIRFSLKNPEIFEAELSAIQKVAEKHPDKKFGIMFPQIILESEMQEAYKIFKKFERKNMVIGAMIETPAAVQIIRAICKFAKFISFGTNDLTQYTLAVDRGNSECQYLYDEMHPSVLSQLKRVIDICKEYNVETSICGQAGSKKEMVEYLVKCGINSVSVNADSAYDISLFILELEKQKNLNPHSNNENIENMAKQKKSNILPIDETQHIEEKIDKKKAEVETAKMEKKLDNMDEESESEAKTSSEENEQEQKQEEFPEFEIGFDPFQEQK